MRHAVAQLVEALRYKPKAEGTSLEFFTDIILPAALWLWDSVSNRNEYQFVGLISAPSNAECLEIWEH